jgi:predicted  nucleic acid-binding Zn-ribbon protein
MDATPPPEFADHEKRITQLENTVNNLSCELQSLRTHIDARFQQVEAALRAEFQKQLHEAVEKINARMDAQYHMMVALQVAVLLALVALIAG